MDVFAESIIFSCDAGKERRNPLSCFGCRTIGESMVINKVFGDVEKVNLFLG